MIGVCRFSGVMDAATFADWGWRIPFLVSVILLVFSVYIRLKLNESPVFQRMKAEGRGSKSPLTDSFLRYPNNKYVLLALLGATAGQGVVWYTGQFYALFFLTITLKVDGQTAYTLIAIALLLGTPFFIVFGALSDRIGRLKIILAGCLIAALTYFPLFQALTHYVNPALESFAKNNVVSVQAKECNFHIFVGPWSNFTDCDRAKDFLTKSGLSFTSTDLPADAKDNVIMKIGPTEVKGWNEASVKKALADLLVELFPTKIRYTSMSLPYHIGNGWFGGMLPLLATAMVAASGDIYYGLWYPIIVALMTVVVGALFLRDNKEADINH